MNSRAKFTTASHAARLRAVELGVPSFFIIPHRIDDKTELVNIEEKVRNIAYSDDILEDKINRLRALYSQFSGYYRTAQSLSPQYSDSYYKNGYAIIGLFEELTGLRRDDIESVDSTLYNDLDIQDTIDPSNWEHYKQDTMFNDSKTAELISQSIDYFVEEYSTGYVPPVGNEEVSVAMVKCNPVLKPNGESIAHEDIAYIFSEAEISQYVPYLATKLYGDDGILNQHTRIISVPGSLAKKSESDSWTSISVIPESRASYLNIATPSSAKTVRYGGLIFTLWLGDPDNVGLAYGSRRNSFVSMSIKVGLGMNIIVPQPGTNRIHTVEGMVSRISNAFPMLDFSDQHIVGYRCKFQVLDTRVSDRVLIDYLTSQLNTVGEFFGFKKSVTGSTVEKDKPLLLTFRTGDVTQQRLYSEIGVKIEIVKQYFESDARVRGADYTNGVEEHLPQDVNMPAGTQCYLVKITNSITQETMRRIQTILRTVFKICEQYSDPNDPEYDYIKVEGVEDYGTDLTPEKAKSRGVYLNPNYGTICNERPIIVRPGTQGSTPWPYGSIEKVYLESPYPNKPYVVTMHKTMGGVVTIYPMCSASPEDKYVEGSSGKGNSYETIMAPSSGGYLHVSVRESLMSFKDADYQRYGVEQVPYSVLICINAALHGWLDSKSLADRDIENMSRGVYQDGKKINFEMCKQQMFDVPVPEIQDYINTDSYLDPTVFVCLLEEYYNINLVVYSSLEYLKEPKLTRPRCSGTYYKRAVLDKPTVVVISHVGTRFSSSGYPHCELVGTDDSKVFSSDLALYSWNMIAKIYSDVVIPYSQDISINQGIGTGVIFRYPIISQRINKWGKCVSVVASVGEVLCTFMTGESEPHNCPATVGSDTLTDVSIIDSLDERPVAISMEGDIVNGVWLQAGDVASTVLLLITPTPYPGHKGLENLEVVTDYSHKAYSPLSVRDSIMTMKYNNEVFKIIITWLFRLAYKNDIVDVLFDSLIVKQDSTLDFSRLPCQFPAFSDIQSALDWLASKTTGLLDMNDQGYAIVCPTERYRSQMIKLLNIRLISEPRQLDTQTSIPRANVNYIFQNTKLGSESILYFKSKDSYLIWLNSETKTSLDVKAKIFPTTDSQLDQYVTIVEGAYYLIQNFPYDSKSHITRESDEPIKKKRIDERKKAKRARDEQYKLSKDRSIMVSSVWNSSGVNLGYKPIFELDGITYTATQYVREFQITEVLVCRVVSGEIVPSSGTREQLVNGDPVVTILEYSELKYAAMLRL